VNRFFLCEATVKIRLALAAFGLSAACAFAMPQGKNAAAELTAAEQRFNGALLHAD
jgi:hypothetical protein